MNCKIEIGEGFVLKLSEVVLDLEIDKLVDVDPQIGEISPFIFSLLLDSLIIVIKTGFTFIAVTGIPAGFLMTTLGLDFINLDNTLMVPLNHYLILLTTPSFKIDLFNS